jgi:hypothetical protein
MAWTVEILNASVTAELAALPDDMQARFQWIVHLIEARGLEQVHQPYIDHLDPRAIRDGQGQTRCGRQSLCEEDPKDASG